MPKERKKVLCMDAQRHAEYYGMQQTFDELYAKSKAGEVFNGLMELVLSPDNIMLAYRNIKTNTGSYTAGTDKQNIGDIGRLPPAEVIGKVRKIVTGSEHGYRPKPVRRKDIPKPNGKTRPLGIPCIWDRLVQQCIKQILEPICEAMFDGLAKRKPDCFAVKQYRKFKLSSGKTAKSILISCGARLAPFDIPQLREIMSYDELDLDKLGDEKSALFFLISDTDTTYNFLVALAFSQMFNLLCERADNTYGGRLPYHVRVLWDEAANTGQVPGLEKIVAVIRSREISLTLFYQAMSQCKALYKDHSETIMGNMDSIVFLGGREASTLKDISENWLGKATISMQTEGRSRGQSESYSQNMQRLGRELMTTSEITTMPGDKCILQLRGLPPFLSPKYDLKKHPNYKYTAEFDKKKNAFRLESLFRHRPLRLKPEDEYTVYEVDGSDTDEEADLLNFDDLDSDEFV